MEERASARRTTVRGRIVYDRPEHRFHTSDLLRILRNLIQDGQLTYADRLIIIAEIFISSVVEAFRAVLSVLGDYVVRDEQLGVDIAQWLTNLGLPEVDRFLIAWAKARERK